MKTTKFIAVILKLFSDGDGQASGGETAAAEVPATAPKKAGKKGVYDNVVFGKQDVATEVDNTPAAEEKQVTPEDKQKMFDELMRGEYKEQYTKATQDIINKRFKETKRYEEDNKKFSEMADYLSQKYGTNGDLDKTLEAIRNDDSVWEDAAYDAGMTVEQFKQLKKLEKQNAELTKIANERKQEEQTQAQLQEWYRQAEETKKTFPSFDLNVESQNPQFIKLLQSGVPVDHAFKVIHMDDITTNAMVQTARIKEKQLTDNIRAKGNRPLENGTSNQSAFIVKDDVRKFTKEDRREIARRAARGEKIVL